MCAPTPLRCAVLPSQSEINLRGRRKQHTQGGHHLGSACSPCAMLRCAHTRRGAIRALRAQSWSESCFLRRHDQTSRHIRCLPRGRHFARTLAPRRMQTPCTERHVHYQWSVRGRLWRLHSWPGRLRTQRFRLCQVRFLALLAAP